MHYYTKEAEPAHFQEIKSGKNKGQLRPTTIRDAKKLKLIPSVTTVLGIIDKPALTNWKVEQSLKAAYEYPPVAHVEPKESLHSWRNRLKEVDAKAQAEKAAQEGTDIHDILEKFFNGEDVESEDLPLCLKVSHLLADHYGDQEWKAEQSFTDSLGFAGKIDLSSHAGVVDFKTKSGSVADARCYEDHFRQLAAYEVGAGLIDSQNANLFISRDTFDENGVNECKLVLHTPEQQEKGWAEFEAILNCWKVLKGYDASLEGKL